MFSEHSVIGKNCLANTLHLVKHAGKFSKFFAIAEPLLKIICESSAFAENYLPHGEPLLKMICQQLNNS
jgi:hypothetical protein